MVFYDYYLHFGMDINVLRMTLYLLRDIISNYFHRANPSRKRLFSQRYFNLTRTQRAGRSIPEFPSSSWSLSEGTFCNGLQSFQIKGPTLDHIDERYMHILVSNGDYEVLCYKSNYIFTWIVILQNNDSAMRFCKFQARGRVSFFGEGATRFFLMKSSAKICNKGVKNLG